MQTVFPDYYKDFCCIGGACAHNCCIGWEIDIDPDTAARYAAVPGELGARLQKNIAWDAEQPHFILGEGERCPFLNSDGLCDLIIALGEESLCGICADHPRFRNELPGRVETGLGLCCEEAGRLILGRRGPMVLEISGEAEGEDEIVSARDEALKILRNREHTIPERAEELLDFCGGTLAEDMGQWAERLLELERLDEVWTELLVKLRDQWTAADVAGFDAYMALRQVEYENLMAYFLYRHLANAVDGTDFAARGAFAVLGYRVLHMLGAIIWTETGEFSFPQQVELARLFSSEIEYSDENLDMILDDLAWC